MQTDIKDLDVFYINMDRHADRNTDMIQLGKELQLNSYSRIPGVDLAGYPKAGCATSHYNIIKDINKPTVILEDDCVISKKETVIEIPDDADAIYLGLSSWGYLESESRVGNLKYTRHKDFNDIYKIDGMLGTHAVLYITPEYIEMAIRIAKWSADNDKHIDQGLALEQKYFNVYALGNPLFYQHSNTKATNIKLKGK
jgi:GR25 family glycosyltransferase involved in LPS biosynthesis